MTDLNTLIPANSPLYLIGANSVNARGQIAGTAFDQTTGATVPFLATPCGEQNSESEGCRDGDQGTEIRGQRPQIILPENVREQLRSRRALKLFKAGVTADNAEPATVNFLREDLGINFGRAASTIAKAPETRVPASLMPAPTLTLTNYSDVVRSTPTQTN